MKKTALVVVSALLTMVALQSGNAQEVTKGFGVFYGGSEPWQKAGSYYDHGYYLFGATASINNVYVSSLGSLDLRFDAAWVPWKMKGDRENYKSTIWLFDLRGVFDMPLMADGAFSLGPSVGIGFYSCSYEVPETERAPDGQHDFGINFGGEATYRLSDNVALTLGAIHHIAFTDYVGQVKWSKIHGKTSFTVVSLTVSYSLPAE